MIKSLPIGEGTEKKHEQHERDLSIYENDDSASLDAPLMDTSHSETYERDDDAHFQVENTHFVLFPSPLSGDNPCVSKVSEPAKIRKLRKTVKSPFSLNLNLINRARYAEVHIRKIRTAANLSEIKESFGIVSRHYNVLKAQNRLNLIDFFDDNDFFNCFYQMINNHLVRISIEYASGERDDISVNEYISSCADFAKKAPNIGNTLNKLEGLMRPNQIILTNV